VKARIEDGKVILGSEGYALYEQSGLGRPLKDGLRLSPVEALYLIYRGRIEIEGYNFDTLLVRFSEDAHMLRSFLVYRDIRERGYVVQTGPHDFRVFRRGEKPGKGESQYMIRVLSERDLIDFAVVRDEVRTTLNMRKQHVLAVVDDEFEITYYEVKIQKPAALEEKPVPSPASGILSNISAIINAGADSGFDQAFYGKRLDDSRIVLATVETAYLLEQDLIKMELEGQNVSSDDYLAMIKSSDSEMEQKIAVYRHLRSLNYIPKTGYKFGHHLRVYIGNKIHSEMLVQAIGQGETLPMNSISRSVRMAHSVKKKMLFASIHNEGIVYIEFARIKL
jgi:tRNA-intron endonuclease, archaea type